MSGNLSMVWLVASRELREAARRKSFWAVFGVLLVGSTAAMIVPEIIGDEGVTRYDIVLVGDAPIVEEALLGLEQNLDAKLDITTVDEVATAQRRVEDDEADIGVVAGDDPRIIVQAGENDRLVGAAGQALSTAALVERLGGAGLSEAEVQDVIAAPEPRLQEVQQETSSRRAASFVLSLVLYILLLSLMAQVATGTAVEKANRISEVLLPIVRPGVLLFGKVLGIGLAGIGTLAAGFLPVVIKLGLGGDLPEGLGGALAGSAAWFVLGLALYLTLSAALGALVERQEEAGSAVTPLTFTLVGTFLVAQSAADSPLGTVLSYLPITSPLMTPTRIAIGVTSPVELAASLGLLVVAIAVTIRFGSTIYGRAIVRTGRRLKLREVLT